MNAYDQPMTFSLPHCPTGWQQVINTALPMDEDLPEDAKPFQGAQATHEKPQPDAAGRSAAAGVNGLAWGALLASAISSRMLAR